MKKLKSVIVGGLALVLAISLVAGACAPAAPPEVTEEVAELEEEIADLEDEVAAKGKEIARLEGDIDDLEDDIAALKKPAEVLEWKFVDVYPRNSVVGRDIMAICEEIAEATNGQLELTYYGSGEFIPAGEVADAVSEGVVDGTFQGHGYWVGKVGSLDYLNMMPMPRGTEFYEWYYLLEPDGLGLINIFQKAFAEHNVHYLSFARYYNTDFIFSRIPIEKASDLAGMKVRASGMCSAIMDKLGASTVWLPWEELYLGLETGAVDACEWGQLEMMYNKGIHEVANYWYLPTWTAGNNDWLINMDSWNSVPENSQKVVARLVFNGGVKTFSDVWVADLQIMPALRDAGINLEYWDEEDLATFTDAYKEAVQDIGTSGEPYCDEAYEVIQEFWKVIGL